MEAMPEAWSNGLRSSLISKNKDKKLETSEQGALYDVIDAQDADLSKLILDEDVQKIVVALHGMPLIKDKEYRMAKKVILKHIKAQPDNPVWANKLDYMAKEDFYNNYYMTRVRERLLLE